MCLPMGVYYRESLIKQLEMSGLWSWAAKAGNKTVIFFIFTFMCLAYSLITQIMSFSIAGLQGESFPLLFDAAPRSEKSKYLVRCL